MGCFPHVARHKRQQGCLRRLRTADSSNRNWQLQWRVGVGWKAVLQSEGGKEKATEDLQLWAANKCWQRLLFFFPQQPNSEHIQANIKIPTRIFQILLRKISTLCPSLNLQSAIPWHLHKMLFKNTPGFDDGWESRRFILRGVWRRGWIYTSPSSFMSAMSSWCLYSSLSVQMAQYSDCSKDAVQWCAEGTQLGLFGFPALITEGFDFCSLVFWIIYLSCPERSAPCK